MEQLLKYQDIDMQIKKLENEISGSEERKKATEMQQYLKEYQTRLIKYDTLSETVYNNYKTVIAVYEDLAKKIENISKLSEKASEEKVDELITGIAATNENLAKIEKEIFNVSNQMQAISKDVENILKNAKTAKKNLILYRDAYSKIKQAREPEIEKLKKQLASQETKIDKKLLSKYLAKHNDKNLPVFVAENSGRCGGCRMEIPGSGKKYLQEKGYIECENCGRIIYNAD